MVIGVCHLCGFGVCFISRLIRKKFSKVRHEDFIEEDLDRKSKIVLGDTLIESSENENPSEGGNDLFGEECVMIESKVKVIGEEVILEDQNLGVKSGLGGGSTRLDYSSSDNSSGNRI